MSYHLSSKRILSFFINFLFIPFFLQAQKIPHIKVSMPDVASITKSKDVAKVIQLDYSNMIMNLLFDKKNHLREKEETFSLKDGEKLVNDLYYNSKFQKTFYTSKLYSPSRTVEREIDENFSNGKRNSGWAWEKENGTQIVKKLDLKLGYQPYNGNPVKPIVYNPDFSYINEVTKPVKGFPYASLPYSSTLPNNKYFTGGTESINAYVNDEGYRTEETLYKNASGKTLYKDYEEYLGDGHWLYEYTDYDCDGNITYFASYIYCEYEDDDIEVTKMWFKNGKPVKGYHDVDDDFDYYYEEYDPETDDFVYRTDNDYYAFRAPERDPLPQDCDSTIHHIVNTVSVIHPFHFFVGPSLIVEDAGTQHFNTYGLMLDYTHFLNPSVGVTGDAGINFGSHDMNDYTKFSLMAGVTGYPFSQANANQTFQFSLHAVVGGTYLNDHYQYGAYSGSSSSFNFSGDFGIGADYHFSDRMGLGLRLGYNPVFSSSISGNWRVGIGVGF